MPYGRWEIVQFLRRCREISAYSKQGIRSSSTIEQPNPDYEG